MRSSGPSTSARDRRRSADGRSDFYLLMCNAWAACLHPSNRRRVLVPLNESNVYERGERGLSSACTQGMRSNGNESNSQQTLKVISCDSGTKSSLELNCYFTMVYISTNPTLGVALLVPPMLLVILHMYTQVLSISTLLQSIVLLVLCQRCA